MVPVNSASIPASFGCARFEQFRHARQAAGDVAGLCRFLRKTRQHVANRNLLSVENIDDGADLEGDGHQ
jgi:hypothetical protein